MSSRASEAVVQMGKLVVHVVENGHSYELECHERALVKDVQKYLASKCGISFNDQILFCLGLELNSQCPLLAYKLPSDGREVFLFNKARMRSNSPHPAPERVEILNIPDPPLPSSSHNPHPLDDASDPALKALPSYERQFRYHCQFGDAIYSRTLAKFETCGRLLQEQKVQERALEIARGDLDHHHKMIHKNYTDFMKCYSLQHRSHTNLLATFGRLSSINILLPLQTAHRKCLLDFVKEENLQNLLKECSRSQMQFESKVAEFKLKFEDLESDAEHIFSGKAPFLIKDLELSIKGHQLFINEQKSIMQALSKNLNTVKKLVDDCLPSQMTSSLRPHDAVSALGPMYNSHDKSYLPKMQSCEHEISCLLDICRDKKNGMNIFVHNSMQKIAYIQFAIKHMHYEFRALHEVLMHQNIQFKPLKVVCGIGPAYRACLAEVVRRKATKKIYMGKAGQLAEKLATERDAEVRRREEFHKVHSAYIPQDILESMGLCDVPNPYNVYVAPFDSNLLDIDLSDLERYAPESLAEVEGAVDFPEKYDYQELLEGSELLKISGTSKMEVENAKLKAELASKIGLICSMSAKLDSLLKNAAEKTTEALHLKDEYEKHLQSMLEVRQTQCESYEKRIQELEQRLSDQCRRGHQPSAGEDAPFAFSTKRTDDDKSEVSGAGEAHMHHTMEEVSCASVTLRSRILAQHDKPQEGLDDNMTDSSITLNPQLDSSMLDQHRDKGHPRDKDKKTTPLPDSGTALTTISMVVSMSQPPGVLSCETAMSPGLYNKASDGLVLDLQNALAKKSNQLDNADTKIHELIGEVSMLGRELDINAKLLDESQIKCAHLENCLHEAREVAQTHLSAADHRVSCCSTLRVSAIKMRGLFERLRSCVSSVGVAAFSDSLCSLAQSLASSSESDDESTAEFHECIRILADIVGLLSRQHAELLERSSKAEAANERLNKELEEKKELANTLYVKHQLEKQANKEYISFGRLEVHEIAAFVLNSSGHFEAISRSCPYHYLSAESVALFANNLPSHPSYLVGQVVHIERRIVEPPPSASAQAESHRDEVDTLTPVTGTSRSTQNPGSTSNPYSLPVGCEYFVVTVAMLPDTKVHSPPS